MIMDTRAILQILADQPIGGPEIMAEAERLLADPQARPSRALREAAYRANKIWLPQGRNGAQRSKEPDLKQMAENHARKDRQQREEAENVSKLLDYYATTTIPADRIATHIGKERDLEFVISELRKRGRKI